MKVLFVGGTGLISTAVTNIAAKKAIDLTVLNRGNKNQGLPSNVQTIVVDINDKEKVKEVLKDKFFDVVVEWIAFTKEDVVRDYELFKSHTKQYIFISSASAYQKPVQSVPITENTPLENPYWEYSRNKIACEVYLQSLNDEAFKTTIVRPSHTYDDQSIVFQIKSWEHPYTVIDRMINDQPIVIPGDGNTLWTLTHHEDFAEGFIDLFMNPDAFNEAFTLTSTFTFTWNELANSFYKALDKTPKIIHIPIDFVVKYFPHLKAEIYGDNGYNAVFDNTKIKRVAPNYRSKIGYTDRVKKIVEFFQSDPSKQTIDTKFNETYDAMIKAYSLRNSNEM